MGKDFIRIQKDIANDKIEVVEGAFIGMVIGLLTISVICILL